MIETGLLEERIGVYGSCFISTSKMAALIKNLELQVAFKFITQAFLHNGEPGNVVQDRMVVRAESRQA